MARLGKVSRGQADADHELAVSGAGYSGGNPLIGQNRAWAGCGDGAGAAADCGGGGVEETETHVERHQIQLTAVRISVRTNYALGT